ncbi:MAG: hypothetical protein M1829_003710 [Trizodia sp. TS-e1964]|nr:MAG: hypothetical protein M1829_003710 [Trizodia sp. TS-e1964]
MSTQALNEIIDDYYHDSPNPCTDNNTDDLVRKAQLKIALDNIQPSRGSLPRKPPNHSKPLAGVHREHA